MKSINKAMPLLVAVMLTSCSSLASPNSVMPAIANATPEVIETLVATPTTIYTAAPTLLPTRLPSTETPPPTKTSFPISGTPKTIALENELRWTECIVPWGFPYWPSYNYDNEGYKFATTCLNMDWAGSDDHNIMLNGQRLREERLDGNCGDNLRLIIGNDVYETRYTVPVENRCGSYDYELLKNGVVIATVKGVRRDVVDANRKLWNIGGKSVWEIHSDPPAENLSAILIDGVNLNEKYQLDGSFYAYYLKDKIIFIALKNGKYRVVYDGNFTGPEYDEIFMSDGDGITVLYGHEQYWFWARQEGTYYVVAIR